MKNIFLIGFMGSGKSRLAEAAAERFGRPLLECDKAIEELEGMTVAEIFSRKGERYFREKETELLKRLNASDGKIVSCGGGMAMNRENTDIMRMKGGIVFLDTPFDVCFGRIRNDAARPVANGKTAEEMLELFKIRRMVYLMEADEVLDGAKELLEKIEILQQFKENNRW